MFEVDQDSNVVHIKSLEKPQSSKKAPEEAKVYDSVAEAETSAAAATTDPAPPEAPTSDSTEAASTENKGEEASKPIEAVQEEPWPESFNEKLTPFLTPLAMEELKKIYLEGPEPPLVSDSGWAGRAAKKDGEGPSTEGAPAEEPKVEEPKPRGARERGGRGRDKRGGRGGRGGGRGGNVREDPRKVVSEVRVQHFTLLKFCTDKDYRVSTRRTLELHSIRLSESSSRASSILRLTTSRKSSSNGQEVQLEEEPEEVAVALLAGNAVRPIFHLRGPHPHELSGDRAPRGTYPPYIHFTLQKTNRDTQDALGHLSRLFHCPVRDLSVAGTKDKRGVTTQRVSLKRNNKTVEDVWKLGNGIGPQRSPQDALTTRGERGIRIADLVYRKAGLELGMLKGNAFIITLR